VSFFVLILKVFTIQREPGSSVSIATDYGLDSPGSNLPCHKQKRRDLMMTL